MTPALLKKYLKMKRLLLPLLAALALPTAVNAESFGGALCRKSWVGKNQNFSLNYQLLIN